MLAYFFLLARCLNENTLFTHLKFYPNITCALFFFPHAQINCPGLDCALAFNFKRCLPAHLQFRPVLHALVHSLACPFRLRYRVCPHTCLNFLSNSFTPELHSPFLSLFLLSNTLASLAGKYILIKLARILQALTCALTHDSKFTSADQPIAFSFSLLLLFGPSEI